MINKQYIEDLIYGRKSSFFFGAFLFLLSLVYGSVVRIRAAAYRVGLGRSRRLPVRVISIGNITLGGTGKTPAVIAVAGSLHQQNRRPLVISRGYGIKNESEVLIVSDGTRILTTAEDGGDEPVLIGSRLKGVPVVVGRNRYRAGMVALRQFAADAVILDDGFQHMQLARDLNILLIDATSDLENPALFPAGPFREPLSSIKRADAVVITRAENPDRILKLQEIIRGHTQSPIFTSRHVPVDIISAAGQDTRALSSLQGTAVFAFSGIGRPESFHYLLASLGAVIKGSASYPDHYAFKKDDLAVVYQRAVDSGAVMIITTEKDMTRLSDLKPEGIWVLRIEMKIQETDEWEDMLRERI